VTVAWNRRGLSSGFELVDCLRAVRWWVDYHDHAVVAVLPLLAKEPYRVVRVDIYPDNGNLLAPVVKNKAAVQARSTFVIEPGLGARIVKSRLGEAMVSSFKPELDQIAGGRI